MTTIAWDGQVLAADRLVTEGGVRVGYTTKIRRAEDGRLLGCCGPMAAAAAAMRWVEVGGDRLNPWPENAEVLEVLPTGRVRCHESGGVVELDAGPQVMGTGARFAQAAMACGEPAPQAVSLAMQFDVYSGGHVDAIALGDG